MKYVLDSNVALKWVLPETDDDTCQETRIVTRLVNPNCYEVEPH